MYQKTRKNKNTKWRKSGEKSKKWEEIRIKISKMENEINSEDLKTRECS